MRPDDLKLYIDRVVEIEFTNGYRALVKLLHISEGEDENDLIYDVVRILDWGSLDPARIDSNAAHAASSSEVRRFVPHAAS
jgi:hypothetical protein